MISDSLQLLPLRSMARTKQNAQDAYGMRRFNTAPPMLRGNPKSRGPPQGGVMVASNDNSAAYLPTSNPDPDRSSADPCAVRSCCRYYSMSCFVIVGL